MSGKKVPVSDNKPFVNYKVLCSEKYGRYLVAGKKINAGEVIIREKPVAVGPARLNNNCLCFECLRIIPTCAAKGDSNILCSNCQVAIFCCVVCEARKFNHTIEECGILKNKTISFRVQDFLLPLRVWLIKKKDEELWKKILRLEAHLNTRKDNYSWKFFEKNIINVLKSLKIVDKSEEKIFSELLQQICGILDANAFGMPHTGTSDQTAFRGLYLEASLMAHDCRGNTLSTIDDEFQLTIYASKPINDGEMILFNYTSPLLGMAERQKILREKKYFECDCPMCQDPEELGTNLSTIFCPHCSDGLITFASVKTTDPYAKEKNWKCNKCQTLLSGYLIAFYVFLVKMRVKSVDNSIKELEVLLKNLSSTFHPNHFVMLDIKRKLIALYKIESECSSSQKKILNKILEMNTDILNVLGTVEPGISLPKGVILYDIFTSILHLATLDHSNREITYQEFLEQTERAKKYLERSSENLLFIPGATREGILAQAIKALGENNYFCPYKNY